MTGTSLKSRALRGFRFASMGAVGKTLVDAGAQLILVRLLAPEAFGLFAFAQALTGLVSCFSDMAGVKFLVRKESASQRELSTVFWFEFILGLVVGGLWAVLCVPILTALGKPEQIVFAQGLAVWIIAERLVTPRAVLDRSLKFGLINIAQFIGVVLGVGAMLAAAWAGLGAWSMIIALIVRALVTGVGLWLSAGFRPSLVLDPMVVRALVVFGLPLSLSTALSFAYTNVDYIIVGDVVGYTMVGLYYAAYRYPHYLNQFNVVLSAVVFPSFSKAKDDAQITRGMRLLTRYSAALAFAPVVAMWVEGELLVRLLLGEKWLAALFPFQCFTTLAALRLTLVHWNHVFVVKGKTRAVLSISAINLPLIAGAAWVGVKSAGIEGAAIGVSLASIGTLTFCCGFLLKRELKDFSYLKTLRPALIATLGGLCAALLARTFTPAAGYGPALRLILGMGAYGGLLAGSCGKEFLGLLKTK